MQGALGAVDLQLERTAGVPVRLAESAADDPVLNTVALVQTVLLVFRVRLQLAEIENAVAVDVVRVVDLVQVVELVRAAPLVRVEPRRVERLLRLRGRGEGERDREAQAYPDNAGARGHGSPPRRRRLSAT